MCYHSMIKNRPTCGNTSSTMYSQFFIPINSSTRPSYVSCVRSGVIISTRLSRTIKESIREDDDERDSVPEVAFGFGLWRVNNVANR